MKNKKTQMQIDIENFKNNGGQVQKITSGTVAEKIDNSYFEHSQKMGEMGLGNNGESREELMGFYDYG